MTERFGTEAAKRNARGSKEFGEFLKAWRMEKGLSQRDIAVRLKYQNTNFISMLEHASSNIPISRIKDIVDAYELPDEMMVAILMNFHPDVWATLEVVNAKVFKANTIDAEASRCQEMYQAFLGERGLLKTG